MRRSLILLALPSAILAQAVEAWQIIISPQASIIFARDGSMIGEVGKESRFSVPLRTLPKYVGQAFVAVEDQRFYQHDGVDLIGKNTGLETMVTDFLAKVQEERKNKPPIPQRGYTKPLLINPQPFGVGG